MKTDTCTNFLVVRGRPAQSTWKVTTDRPTNHEVMIGESLHPDENIGDETPVDGEKGLRVHQVYRLKETRTWDWGSCAKRR